MGNSEFSELLIINMRTATSMSRYSAQTDNPRENRGSDDEEESDILSTTTEGEIEVPHLTSSSDTDASSDSDSKATFHFDDS